MQKNETIINQFARTIKESTLDVKGDPILLDMIFSELEKKKKRKRFFTIFLSSCFVIIGLSFVFWGISLKNEPIAKINGLLAPSELIIPNVPNSMMVAVADNDVEKHHDVIKTKKKTPTPKKENVDFQNVVSYKFNNHQVDVFENGDEEFIQINVFGADGMEQDVLKIMEDLKKSYRNNSVYVDSVKHK